jgi:hypothetical protein
MTEPHYVRVARALALLGALGTAPGCGLASTPPQGDAAAANDADTMADASSDVDAAIDCTTCTCGLTADDAGVPFCSGQATLSCGCAAVGPLAPPDLPALA